MFERFTDGARRAVVLAQEEARLLDHNYIGTEHLLLGLIETREGIASTALVALGVGGPRVREAVESIVGRGSEPPVGHIPFTPRAKKVLELALRESLQLGHNYIGTEHLLLGLIREGEGVACQVLEHVGVDVAQVRETVVQLISRWMDPAEDASLAGSMAGAEEPSTSVGATLASAVLATDFPTCPACGVPLVGSLRVRTLEAASDEGVERIKLAYCGGCGATLQVVP